jgi:hypothetical protein
MPPEILLILHPVRGMPVPHDGVGSVKALARKTMLKGQVSVNFEDGVWLVWNLTTL